MDEILKAISDGLPLEEIQGLIEDYGQERYDAGFEDGAEQGREE